MSNCAFAATEPSAAPSAAPPAPPSAPPPALAGTGAPAPAPSPARHAACGMRRPTMGALATVLVAALLVGCGGADQDASGTGSEAGTESAAVSVGGDSADPALAGESGAIETPDLTTVAGDDLSPERRATLGAWAATQMASGAGEDGEDDLGSLMRKMDAGADGSGEDGSALGDMSQDRLGELGLEMETPYDLMAVEAATGLFSAQVGTAEPDMQNFGLHIVTTYEFSNLRGAEPMPLDARATHGDIWIVVFDTAEPLTPSTFLPENLDELGDVGDTDPLAGPDGLTTVYYTLTLANDFSGGRFVGIGKGVLTDETSWTRADLESLDAD